MRRHPATSGIARFLLPAALALWTAGIPWTASWAGSCCGGGGGTSLILPKSLRAAVDLCLEYEKYRGFWNQDGKHLSDPPGSDLQQYRVNLSYAQRLASKWQAGVTAPYVWNVNKYSGISSDTDGFGDSTLSLWYEAVDERSVWKAKSWSDLVPSVTIGPSLLIPTGKSPFDDVRSSFDVTGRGFYRVDGNLVVDKTLHPFTANLALAYGVYIERPVNKEYGKFVQPYREKLGDRSSASFSLGYIHFIGTGGNKLTGTVSILHIEEAETKFNGVKASNTGFRKTSAGAQLAWSSTDHDWSARAGWNHAIREDGWGKNFPTTDIYTVGVRYGFR